MKLRPLLILLLFVVSTGILVWIYYAATHRRTHAEVNPWAETIGDLDACCRRKHVKSMQYDRFAEIADSERYADAARLFRAMAFSARLQENNCATAILRLGGKYDPPVKVLTFHGHTPDNLTRSISYERTALDEMQGRDIGRAMDKGNRYAARVLIWAAAEDLKNVVLMERCRVIHAQRTAGKDPGPCHYLICPVCGNIYETDYCDRYCPNCLTEQVRFIGLDDSLH